MKEYGKAHILYEIQVFGNVLATLGVLVYSLIKKKNASHNLAIGFILIELLIVGMYAFNRITGFEIELYTVLCELEICSKETEDYKRAYNIASEKVQLLEKMLKEI